jgi:two-component system cell cycle sensor histidine kinase/response regulator CckA
MHTYLIIIVAVSLAFQFMAAYLALRLVKVTGRNTAWLVITAAITVFALRRCFTLYSCLTGNPIAVMDVVDELVALTASALMAVGLALIEPLFLSVKQSEARARQNEEKYRILVNNIPAMVFTGYEDETIDFFDDKIEKLTGYTREEFHSRQVKWIDLIDPEDLPEYKRQSLNAFHNNKSYIREYRIRPKLQQPIWIQERSQIICSSDGKIDYISGVFFDITEQKQAEETRAILEAQLLQAQKLESIGRLAGGIAHDFNNLLSAIIGFGEITKLDLPPDNHCSSYVEEILKAADRGATLTKQLLAFSRKQILQPRVLNLNEVVVDLETMLQRLIGENIDLEVSLSPTLGNLKADPSQIEQVIVNLAVNARDAMPEGGKLTIETTNIDLDEVYTKQHKSVTPGPYVLLAVSDTGHGMQHDTLPHIFEPFYTNKEQGKGTGMGLATVYGIVKQSGGDIWVYSEPEKGSIFKIYLPRVEAAPEVEEKRVLPARELRGHETILLVEDEELVRTMLSEALRRYGYQVLEAAQGSEAMMFLTEYQSPVGLLLTDVVMPEMSGQVLAERMVEINPELKVLFTSGYSDNAIVRHGILRSGVHFIQKPFTIVALLQKIREVLDS